MLGGGGEKEVGVKGGFHSLARQMDGDGLELSVLHLGLLDQALAMDDFSDWSCLFRFTIVI